MNIIFDSININNLFGNSGVFNGENTQEYWTTQLKENHGVGRVIGYNNLLMHNINVIYDNDLIDMPIQNNQLQVSEAKKGNEKDN
ncbi:hypothetical protein [Bacillus sp. Marseille-Q3570]|uniref:hypothetical protein n=1 Tax=Bacillus sp. Marseille-Q3570 TaxID=2963522 RepID=UPI0021B78228|nr:hypothetical protein [Bacillus sp. Marseille-Q3570]